MAKLVLLALIVFYGFFSTNGRKKNNQSLRYTKCEVKHNHFYMNSFNAKIAVDRESIDLDMNFAKNLTEDLWAQLRLSKWDQATAEYRTVVLYEINLYDVIRKGTSDKLNIVYTWINNFFKYGDLPLKVPFLQGVYAWRGCRPYKNSIPVFLQGKYRTQLMTFFKFKDLRDGFMNLTYYYVIRAT